LRQPKWSEKAAGHAPQRSHPGNPQTAANCTAFRASPVAKHLVRDEWPQAQVLDPTGPGLAVIVRHDLVEGALMVSPVAIP
jgi:hypothetical protein